MLEEPYKSLTLQPGYLSPERANASPQVTPRTRTEAEHKSQTPSLEPAHTQWVVGGFPCVPCTLSPIAASASTRGWEGAV